MNKINVNWQVVEDNPHLVDIAGNQLQDDGGVVPKACVYCGKDFTSTVKQIEVTQAVSIYKCNDCDFENASGDYAWDHRVANPTHTVQKIVDQRVVGTNTIVEGDLPQVVTVNNQVIVCHTSCGTTNGVL